MNLASLSPLTFLAGLVGLAGGLYLLQRLRVRHERVPVVTTLFWRQAVEDSRARERTQRFRHPLAYALSLALLFLLWSVVGGLRGDGRAERDVVLLLDHSARAALGDRLARESELLLENVPDLPRSTTTVLAVGAGSAPLLLPGESPVLLRERVAVLEAQAAPSRLDATLASLVAGRDPRRPLELLVVGDAPVDPVLAASLPPGVTLARLGTEPLGPEPGVPALVACGVAPAAGGAWSRVDLLVRCVGGGTPTVTLEGQALVLERDPTDPGAFSARDLPAAGGRLEVSLPASASASDDPRLAEVQAAWRGVSLRLPDRPPLRVALGPAVVDLFAALVDADPGLVRDDVRPDVALRAAGEAVGGDVPAFELVGAAEAEHALWLGTPDSRDPLGDLTAAVGELGLDRVDADELASDLGRPIVAGTGQAPVRTLRLWRELLEPGRTSFPSDRAFPVLVARGLRWLADVRDFPREVRAGAPLEGVALPFQEDGPRGRRSLDPLGLDAFPARAGELLDAAGVVVPVGLLDPGPFASTTGAPLPAAELHGGGGPTLSSVLLLLVLALCVLEWHLFRTGRMP